MRLSIHRNKPRGLADLLLADAMVEDGVVLQQDGSLLAAWMFNGPDLASAEPSHMNVLVGKLSRALMLGTGWMIHCDVIRTKAPGYPPRGEFPDPVTDLIDTERRSQFNFPGGQFQSHYYMALTYLPPMAREEKAVSWLVDGNKTVPDVAAMHLARFRSRCESFENVFGSLMQIRRLRGKRTEDGAIYDDLLGYIHHCITGESHPIRLPEIPCGLADSVLSTKDFVGGLSPRIGDKHIRIVAIDGFPKLSWPGILSALDQLPLEYRWSTRAILMDPVHARSMIEDTRVRWRGLARGFKHVFKSPEAAAMLTEGDRHAWQMVEDAEQAKTLAASNEVQFCVYSANVIVMDHDEDRVRESVRMVMSTVQNLGFGCRLEEVNAIEAWRGSIPGDGYANVRRIQMHTMNLADMLPITSVWTGLEFNPSKLMPKDSPPLAYAVTTGSTPFRLNLHVGDLGHSLLVGPSGSGKSTAAGLLVAQWFRYPEAQTFVFDWDYSAWLLTCAVGGTHYDLMGEKHLAFCPLREIDTEADRAWAVAWIEDLCRLNGLQVTPRESNAIITAMKSLSTTSHRTMTHFLSAVQDGSVREAIKYYTLEGQLGRLLDAEADSMSLSQSARMVSFETRALLESRDTRASLPVLLYLFRRIEKRLTGVPTLVVLDEAWAYLAHEIFRDKLEEWLRTMRRRNAAVILATQQLSDIANSPIADTVFANTATKILLANEDADKPAAAEFYQRLGLNSREIAMLRDATRKRDYYVTSPEGKRMVDFVLGQVAVSFVGINAPKQRERAARLMEMHPSDWQAHWLRACGVDDWADYLDRQFERSFECASA